MARTYSPSHTIIGGDSGGGWRYNNTVYGVHHGSGGSNYAYYAPIDEALSALSLTLLAGGQ